MADKHTPGPWEWFDAYNFGETDGNQDWESENFKAGRIVLRSGGKDGELVISDWATCADDGGFTITEANARLIAAAPELLDALVKIHDELMNLQPHIPQACEPEMQPFIDSHVDKAMVIAAAVILKATGVING